MLTLKNVTNRLWDKPILKNINWETELGQNWAILGPNGAGKTTLAKLILGQLPYCGVIQRDEKISNFDEISKFDEKISISSKTHVFWRDMGSGAFSRLARRNFEFNCLKIM